VYRIRIDYQTGNSFGSHDETDYLDLTWENLDVAKANLKRIEEHYDLYRKINKYGITPKEKEKLIETNKNKDWFTLSTYGDFSSSLILKTDDYRDYMLHAFWTGYFERLHGGTIESFNDSMSFTTRGY